MIDALDHLVLICPSIHDGEAAYTRLLGREPDWRANDSGGSKSVIYQLQNMALELMAPAGGGPISRRLHVLLDQQGPGLQTLVLRSAALDDARRTCERRGLRPDDVEPGESIDPSTSRVRSWRRFRINDAATHGVRMFVLERRPDDPLIHVQGDPSRVSRLDHVVINTRNPDRAAALYGARLGLRLALDRSNLDWDARLLFFRVGGVTIEIAHRLSAGEANDPDKLWGLSWHVPDIARAHARLKALGLVVSEIRGGRRPGTRVFTVKDQTMGVPTLILAEDGASQPA